MSYTEAQAQFIRTHFDPYAVTAILNDGDRYDSAPGRAETFRTNAAMIRAVAESGSHFFDVDTLRFFSARTPKRDGRPHGGRFFVLSDIPDWGRGPRRYQVGYVTGGHGGGFLTVERFGHYASNAEAHKFARRAARLFA